jgi:hypothetical protein
VNDIVEPFTDGFEMSDLWNVVTQTMTFAESFDLAGADKKKLAMEVLEIVLDHDKIDLPGPDWLTKRVILWFAPSLIDKFVSLAKEKVKFG